MMYEELVKLARHCSEIDACINCPVGGCEGTTGIMNRLANAIEELNKRTEGLEAMREISPEAEYAINKHADNLISHMEELISGLEDKPRWIPVTEQLPSYRVAVLVYAPYQHNQFMAYWSGDRWYVWAPLGVEYPMPDVHKITHWMPLLPDPKPPKEEV